MKIGILNEKKHPLERRVVFSPIELISLKNKYPEIEIKVQSSKNRIFSDDEYNNLGFHVADNINDCDIFIGIKEVPVENLIPNKTYFFFSHTIKKQPHNRNLLKQLLAKNIKFYDHETIVNENNQRLIGFGLYAGMSGTYNAIKAFGIKFELFKLPRAHTLNDKEALVTYLKRQVLPPLKIVVTGKGKVGNGVKEILDAIKVKQVTVDDFLIKKFSQPVYTQLDVLDYNKRKDDKVADRNDFKNNPKEYESNFKRFTNVSDIFIAGHFHAKESPVILSREMLLSKDCTLKIVADISCDIDGSIACTLRSSTIEDPYYGYYPIEDKEVEVFHPGAIVVMAIDNLPTELPKEASIGFGKMFLENVIPAFFNNDKEGILKRALITQNGKLTEKFSYLQDYVDGN